MTACREIRTLFTPYVDGRLPGSEAQSVARHLRDCEACCEDFSDLRSTQSLVSSLGRKQPPAEMAMRLRLALLHERHEREIPIAHRFSAELSSRYAHLCEALQNIMLPATAGLLTAVLCFGVLVGFFAVPSKLSADDIPSGFFTPAKLAFAPFLVQDNCGPDSPVMVEAYVDSSGKVQDYRIVSKEPTDTLPALRQQLDNALIFAQFEPAMVFGKPSPSRVVVSFSRVNVGA
ncbi:MAG: zf-HC2 domain-containing protein [Acidobacteriales bacterium]|nr:zf-HC2 domain-containing protein [Terriglobales bacterium]